METEQLNQLSALIKHFHVAMLSTIGEEGIHCRPMATTDVAQDGLWFFTRSSAEKVKEVREDQQATLSYADEKTNTYVVVSGRIAVRPDREKIHKLWNPFIEAWFPEGPTNPAVSLLQFTPEHAEYWDSGAGQMTVLFRMIKAAVSGESAQSGSHGEINFN